MNPRSNMNIIQALEQFTKANLGEIALALLAGLILGFIFAKLKLPAVSPVTLAGVIGIFGIWLGYILGK